MSIPSLQQHRTDRGLGDNASMETCKRRDVAIECLAACLLTGGCLMALLVALAGCESSSRKAALTQEEIQRLTFAQKPDRPDELIVSGDPVTCEEITTSSLAETTAGGDLRERLVGLAKNTTLEQFTTLARPQVRQRLNGRIADIVLYQRAQRELGDKADEQLDKWAEKELRAFILEHGGNGAVADVALQEMGMNRIRFKQRKRRELLGDYYVKSKFPFNRPITHSELIARYDQMKDEEFFQPGLIQFRLIDIKVQEVELADPNDDPTEAARALASELLARIEAGEDFGALAEQYSHGHRSAFGGLWTPRDPEAIAPPYDVLAERAQGAEVGEVVGPIEVPGRTFIMKLEQKREKGYRPLGEVQDTVEWQILVDRRRQALAQLNTEVAQQAAVANTDRFVDSCLERLYLSVNQPAETQSQP